jgi:poly(beta-D-mannuronate) lyase
MGRKSLAAVMTVLAVGISPVAAQRAAPGFDLSSYRVTHPGTVLIDRAERLATLAHFGHKTKRLCRVEMPAPAANIQPVSTLEGRLGYGGNDRRVAPFDWAVVVHSANAFGTNSRPALDTFMSLLTRWADAGAMTQLIDDVAGSNTSVTFGLKRSLAALIPNWVAIRDDARVPPDQRAKVNGWVEKMVNLADTNTGGRNRAKRILNCPANQDTSNCNNHRYLRDAVNIMWGAASGDDTRYRKGIQRFRVALRQMRADGSLPLETQRGSRALWYQNYAVGMLTTIAETAARQGHDLYGMEIEGRSLHRAIRFLLDGIERPVIVHPYAKVNRAPGPGLDWREQDLRFTEPRGSWHHMAWTEAYLARFPDHANSRRIRKVLPGLFEDRPHIARTSGGNASCLFMQP